MNAIIVNELTKRYGSFTAVDGLSFQVKKGEVFGLLGANGAGKSTTIECILGTKSADSGTISIFGNNPKKDRKNLFQKIGVQFQQCDYQPEICWLSFLSMLFTVSCPCSRFRKCVAAHCNNGCCYNYLHGNCSQVF